MKQIIREYGTHQKAPHKSRLKPFQEMAVLDAVEYTKTLEHGARRLQMVDMVFWSQSHTLDGAALKLYVSKSTVERWHWEFIYQVGKNMGWF